MVPFASLRVTRLPAGRAIFSPMQARSTARLELASAAVLFSTGGAAIKAADFTAWQITCLRSGIAAVAIWLMTREARRRWTESHARDRCDVCHLSHALRPRQPAHHRGEHDLSPVHRAALPRPARAVAAAGADSAAGSRLHGRGGCRARALLRRRGRADGDGAGSLAGATSSRSAAASSGRSTVWASGG